MLRKNLLREQWWGYKKGHRCGDREGLLDTTVVLFIHSFIYLQTANDGRPRPEEIFVNAKVNKNGEAHAHKTFQTENGRWWSYILKGGRFDVNKHVCLTRYKDGFLDRLE